MLHIFEVMQSGGKIPAFGRFSFFQIPDKHDHSIADNTAGAVRIYELSRWHGEAEILIPWILR